MPKERQPSAVTLRVRAFAKVERLKAKLEAMEESGTAWAKKHKQRCDKVQAELTEARRFYSEPEAAVERIETN